MNHCTTAKSSRKPKPARWFYPVCQVCGTVFPYSVARYRYLEKQGRAPTTCSRKCGAAVRWGKVPA
jgi:hypothetical protein